MHFQHTIQQPGMHQIAHAMLHLGHLGRQAAAETSNRGEIKPDLTFRQIELLRD